MSDILLHENFLNDILMPYVMRKGANNKSKAEENGELTSPVHYGKVTALKICPEPLNFISELNECGNNRELCQKKFNELRKSFENVRMPQRSPGLWWNTSTDQINIRFGVRTGDDLPAATQLGDVTVHGLIAGQTGSGKSVLLHNMIFNLMAEYPPWEIDLYLADFKRVEFSKYIDDRFSAPHVVACAATGEIRYVLSLIQHLVDCMNAREDFFKRMGFEKIAKFRRAYPDTVLPRILLVVDEFQQLFLEASPRESEQIQRMLTAIVKKGRATGVHIIFASQEMSNTLSRSALSNFRMRVALNCDPNVSVDIIGNKEAASCPKGYVLVNTSEYTRETNVTFHVPFVETEVSAVDQARGKTEAYFEEFLKGLDQAAKLFHFKKNTKFYQEDYQEPLEDSLVPILEKLKNYRRDVVRKKYFDAMALGRYVTFSSRKYDIQSIFIERGRNKNILAVSPRTDDLCYLMKLFAINFEYGGYPEGEAGMHHYIYSYMPSTEKMYEPGKELLESENGGEVVQTRNIDDLENLRERFARERFLLPIFQEANMPLEFALLDYRRNIEAEIRRRPDLREEREACIPVISEKFKDVTFDNFEEVCRKIQEEEGRTVLGKIAANTLDFCRYKKNPESFLPPTVIWIIGVDVLERMPDWLTWMMKNGMDYNKLFILLAGTEFDNMTQIAKYCDYIFLGGNNRRIYDRLNVNFTVRDADSIVIDMIIKSNGEERSFKKYRYDFGIKESERIPFDELLK